MRCLILLVTMAACFGAWVPASADEGLWRMWVANEVSKGIGQQVGEAITAYSQWQASGIKASQALQEKRQAYWNAYPLDAADPRSKDFFGALWAKDLYYASVMAPEGPDAPRAKALLRIGVKLDGGIPGVARNEFEDWVLALRTAMGATRHASAYGAGRAGVSGAELLLVTPQRLKEALAATQDEYRRYRIRRDWYEYYAAGREQDFYKSPTGYLAYWLWDDKDSRYGHAAERGEYDALHVQQETAESLKAMIRVYGRAPLREATRRVMAAKKGKTGSVEDRESLGLGWGKTHPHVAIRYLLSLESGRGALASRVWEEGGSTNRSSQHADYRRVEQDLRRLFHAYGKQPMLSVGQKLADAQRVEKQDPNFDYPKIDTLLLIEGQQYWSERHAFSSLRGELPLSADLQADLARRLQQSVSGRRRGHDLSLIPDDALGEAPLYEPHAEAAAGTVTLEEPPRRAAGALPRLLVLAAILWVVVKQRRRVWRWASTRLDPQMRPAE